MANALIELVKETMLRLGDESDVERFIPRQPPPGSPGAGATPPPIMPQVNVSIKGQIDPKTSAAIVAPVLQRDQPQPVPASGGAPGPGAPPQTSLAAPPPGAGPH